MCKHPCMVIRKNILLCSWCGHEQKQLPEESPEPDFRSIKEYLE